jgi:hypothetical protein
MLEREQRYITNLQDPPEMAARRTFGRGGRRQLTAAERAEKELECNDKEHNEQSTISANEVISLTGNFQNTPPYSMDSFQQHIMLCSINEKQSNSLIFAPRTFTISQSIVINFSRSSQVIPNHQQSSIYYSSSALSLPFSTSDVNRLHTSVQHSITQVNSENIEPGQGNLSEIVVLHSDPEENHQEEVKRSNHKRTPAQIPKIVTQSASLISSTSPKHSERLC